MKIESNIKKKDYTNTGSKLARQRSLEMAGFMTRVMKNSRKPQGRHNKLAC